jgi:serine/threonine-protein kinase
MYKAPVPIRTLVPERNLPTGLDAVVLKCLTKRPEGRYPTMRELVLDLERLANGLVPDAVSDMSHRPEALCAPADYFRSSVAPALAESPHPSLRRWPIVTAVGTSATLAGLLGVMAIAWSSHRGLRASSPGTADVVSSAAAPSAPVPAALASAPLVWKSVSLRVVPPDARISRAGVDLGTSPVEIALAEGETATLVIARSGYKARTLRVGPGDGAQTVTLETAAPQRGSSSPSGHAVAKPGDSFDDVGDPFAGTK